MNILLINTNPVVSRLISLCMRDESISFEEVNHVSKVSGSRYDIIFIDDASYDDEVIAFLSAIERGRIVFLSSRDTGEEIGTAFDTVVKKPFLPSQIQAVIDSVGTGEEREKEMTEEDTALQEEHFIFPLSSETKQEVKEEEKDEEPLSLIEDTEASEVTSEEVSQEEPETPKVLDSSEIEQIKALLEEEEESDTPLFDLEDQEEIEARKVEVITQKLEEDGLEIVEEEEIIAALSQKPKKKKAKKRKKREEEIYTFEEALLAAIENMKPKKIKKLLKGAEVTIKIRFKDDA